MKKKCRCKKCIKFRKNNSFEFLDIYGLSYTIAEFLIPRLKAFKKHTFSYPANLKSMKEWHNIINKIIKAFEIYAKDGIIINDQDKIEEGLKLFQEYFRDLWI